MSLSCIAILNHPKHLSSLALPEALSIRLFCLISAMLMLSMPLHNADLFASLKFYQQAELLVCYSDYQGHLQVNT